MFLTTVTKRLLLRPVITPAAVCAVLAGGLVLGGCAGKRGGPVPYARTDFTAPDLAILTNEADHRIGPGDVLSIQVLQAATLTGDQTVDPLGRIQMPLLGSVNVSGMTADQVSAGLRSKLDATYLKNPEVRVLVKSVNLTITVDGSVKQPGVYPIGGPITLQQAIALARGADDRANVKRVVVFRQINGQRQAAAFDLSTIRTARDPDPVIYSHDIIVVDGSSSQSIFRDLISTAPLLAIFRPF